MDLVRPLLAADVERTLNRLKYPLLASRKIDGIRAPVVGGVLVSRSMKPIRNKHTQALFGNHWHEGLDGELVVGNPNDKNLMQQTTSGVMSINGVPDVYYYVFDKWNVEAPFHERFNKALDTVSKSPHIRTRFIEHSLVTNSTELEEYEEKVLSEGYEGVMLRSLTGRYKQGRSTYNEGILLKLKRFQDGEARIIGFEPLYHNENPAKLDERGYTKRSSAQDGKIATSRLGAFIVSPLGSKTVFNIGTGFTAAQRENYWNARHSLLGHIVKYKSLHHGVKDAPRHPVFLGFRDPLDMS